MKKMRVLQFSITNSGGGVTQYILNNWKHIDHKKFQFDFVTFSSKLDYENRLLEEGCKVFYVKYRAEENIEGFINELKDIFKNGYDILHLHTTYWKSLYVEKVAKEMGIPRVILHAHSEGIFGINDVVTRLKSEQQHKIIRSKITDDIATDYWACSWNAAHFLYGDAVARDKIRIMHNAVDIEKFKFNADGRQKIRKKLDLDNKLVIGHVGRFSYEKNHQFMIDVLQKFCLKQRAVRLLLVGEGLLKEQIKGQVKKYGLTDKVMFLGKREDVNDLYNAMDMLWLPSYFEGFPIVAVEAQVNGLKCMCSANVTKDINITGEVEFLETQHENEKDWMEAAERLIYLKTDRNMTWEKFVGKEYDINYQIHVLEEAYLNEGDMIYENG